jgi:hypothetical protein
MAGAGAQLYPLLKNSIMTGIVRNIKTDTSTFHGATWCPMKDYPTQNIEWDILSGATGMTPAVYPDAPTPILKHPGLAHKSFQAVQWREKMVFGETDLMYLRKPGTWDEQYGNQMLADRLTDLNTRLETRYEYLRWSMLTGSITITYPDAITQAVDYEVPSGNKPTAGTLWSSTSTADPVANVAAWKLLFRGTAVRLGKLVMNQVTYNYLPANSAIRALIQYQFGYDLVRSGALVPQAAVNEALGGTPIEINDAGYVNDSGTFVPFLADGKVLGLPQSTPERWCEFMSTPNMHHGGQNPQSGKFARPIWHLDDDPISVEVIVGEYGLPVMYHTDWHLYITVG